MSEAKILLSWSPENGLSAKTLRNTMASITSGYVNVVNHYDTLVMVWSPNCWLSREEAETAVKDILSSSDEEEEPAP